MTADESPNSSVPNLWPGGVEPVPASEDTPPGLERHLKSLGFTLSTTGYAVSRRFRELLAPLGLEPREFALLRAVAAAEGVSQQAIGERMNVAPSRMVGFIDTLEERGLLERRQNPDDRRARALFLTRPGRALLESAFQVAVEFERSLAGGLSSQERDRLLELLGRVGAEVGVPKGAHPGMGHSALDDE